ncbi:hypothetical protein HMPREF1154_0081 [Capnocytophaga sp. CM59]|nr:hypothetical protein HMPREF1154_0081 [Capnocytophaga sp. CM59]
MKTKFSSQYATKHYNTKESKPDYKCMSDTLVRRVRTEEHPFFNNWE